MVHNEKPGTVLKDRDFKKKSRLKITYIILIIILYITLFLMLNKSDNRASYSNVKVSVLPESQLIKKGQDIHVGISIDPGNKPISAVQFNLLFNSHVINIINVTESSFLNYGNAKTAFNQGKINNDKGILANSWGVIITPGASVSSNNTFVNITMNAKNGGISRLDLENVIISGPDDNSYQVEILNGTAYVIE
jgi:hypothetical protein